MMFLLEVAVAVAITTTTRLHYDILYNDERSCNKTTDIIEYIIVVGTEGNKFMGINKNNMICDLSKINVIMKQQDAYIRYHCQLLFLAQIITPTKMIELK